MPEYRKEWMAKAKIDYFAPFVNLWLSCNAWYMDHYPELKPTDRAHIDHVKGDLGARNYIFKKFGDLVESSAREGEIFRSNLEQFHFALEHASLVSDKIGAISFTQAVCDYNQPDNKENLICRPKITKNGNLFKREEDKVIKLDTVFVTRDVPKLFSGLFEIIYQVRNCLIHGKMQPEENEYQVVKYGYLLLYDMMAF